MIKRIIGILVAIASLAVLSLVVLNHRSISSLIPERTNPASELPNPTTPAESSPQAIDSLRMQTDTLQLTQPTANKG